MHTRSNPDTIMPGERILLGQLVNSYRNGRNRYIAKFTLVKVDGIDRHHLTGTDENGDTVRIDTRHARTDDKGRRILWDAPLPKGTDDQVRRYCTVLLEGGDFDGALFAIDAVDGDTATGRFLVSRHYVDAAARQAAEPVIPGNEGRVLASPTSTDEGLTCAGTVTIAVPEHQVRRDDGSLDLYGGLLIKELTPSWKAGDLVGCVDYSCAVIDGTLTYSLEESLVVGNFADDRALAEFLPAQAPARHGTRVSDDPAPGSYHKREHEELLALVSLEPDEALVLVYGNDGKGYPSCSVLGSTGRTFFLEPDVTTTLSGIAPADGLWVIDKARHWSSHHDGEYDSGIEGDWRPATLDDLERFGLDMESATIEIADALDRDPAELDGIVERQIAMAEADCREAAAPNPV